MRIIKDLWRVLKLGGKGTNSGCDTVIGTAELPKIREYFEAQFTDVEFWFHDISIGRGEPRALAADHPDSHIDDGYWGTHFIFIHFTKPAG